MRKILLIVYLLLFIIFRILTIPLKTMPKTGLKNRVKEQSKDISIFALQQMINIALKNQCTVNAEAIVYLPKIN